MKISIIDDDAHERNTLQDAFTRLANELAIPLHCVLFDSANTFLSSYDFSYDIVCMDIDMPDIDGMSAAEQLRTIDNHVALVFVTNMAQMALQGYTVHALDFIVKPVNYYSLAIKMKSIISMIGVHNYTKITIPVDEGFIRIDSQQLHYIEVRGHYLFIHTSLETYRIRDTLKAWETKLQGLPFARCSNSFLVNLAAVEAVDTNTVLVQHDHLPLSRSKKKDFMNALMQFMGGMQ